MKLSTRQFFAGTSLVLGLAATFEYLSSQPKETTPTIAQTQTKPETEENYPDCALSPRVYTKIFELTQKQELNEELKEAQAHSCDYAVIESTFSMEELVEQAYSNDQDKWLPIEIEGFAKEVKKLNEQATRTNLQGYVFATNPSLHQRSKTPTKVIFPIEYRTLAKDRSPNTPERQQALEELLKNRRQTFIEISEDGTSFETADELDKIYLQGNNTGNRVTWYERSSKEDIFNKSTTLISSTHCNPSNKQIYSKDNSKLFIIAENPGLHSQAVLLYTKTAQGYLPVGLTILQNNTLVHLPLPKELYDSKKDCIIPQDLSDLIDKKLEKQQPLSK